MGDLLLLVRRPAAEVRKQLLPVCFIFGLNNIHIMGSISHNGKQQRNSCLIKKKKKKKLKLKINFA